jgi:hypothetical protein
MSRPVTVVLGAILLVFVAESIGQHIIYPTYRPPPQNPPVIRTARDVEHGAPQWLYGGDAAPAAGEYPYPPPVYFDDVKLDENRRYARSVEVY